MKYYNFYLSSILNTKSASIVVISIPLKGIQGNKDNDFLLRERYRNTVSVSSASNRALLIKHTPSRQSLFISVDCSRCACIILTRTCPCFQIVKGNDVYNFTINVPVLVFIFDHDMQSLFIYIFNHHSIFAILN